MARRLVLRGLLPLLGCLGLIVLLAAPQEAGASPSSLRGWALLGEEHPVVGADVRFRGGDGRLIPGLRGHTGRRGEFIVPVGDIDLPRRVVVEVRGGFVGRERAPRGALRARVPMRGVYAGLVYVTPISSLAITLREDRPRWSAGRADREARDLLGLPERYDSQFPVWDDGGASIAYSDDRVDPDLLEEHIEEEGGYGAWADDLIEAERAGDDLPDYDTPSARSTTRPRAGFAAAGAVAGAGVGLVTAVARSCNPQRTSIPFLGDIAAMLQRSGAVDRDPACLVYRLDETLKRAEQENQRLETNLQALAAGVGRLQEIMVRQSARVESIEREARDNRFSRQIAAFSATPAAILTVHENTAILADWMLTVSAPRSVRNPQGLGRPIGEIMTADDPEAREVADAIRTFTEENVYGPNVGAWSSAQARFVRPGIVLPDANGPRGIVRYGWESIWEDQWFGAEQTFAFNPLVDYYENLYNLLLIQQIDAWKTEGFAPSEIVAETDRRLVFSRQLGALRRPVPHPGRGLETCGRRLVVPPTRWTPITSTHQCAFDNAMLAPVGWRASWNGSLQACAAWDNPRRTLTLVRTNGTVQTVSVPRCDQTRPSPSPAGPAAWPPTQIPPARMSATIEFSGVREISQPQGSGQGMFLRVLRLDRQ